MDTELERKINELPTVCRAEHIGAILDVGTQTIIKWTSQGKIAHFRAGVRSLRYRREDVRAFVERYLNEAK